jgi:hypothetical protein
MAKKNSNNNKNETERVDSQMENSDIDITSRNTSSLEEKIDPTDGSKEGIIMGIIPNSEDAQLEKFDEFLMESIDEALCSLGEPVKNAVYLHLQNDFGLEKNNITARIEEFSDIMHKIFGLGASRLEIKFLKNLKSKVNVNVQLLEYEWPLSKWIVMDMSFVEYVKSMRKSYAIECQKRIIQKKDYTS